MTTITYTIQVSREKLDVVINCPCCARPMIVENLWKLAKKKKPRFEGTAATCNHCNDESGSSKLYFYSYDVNELIKKIDKFRSGEKEFLI